MKSNSPLKSKAILSILVILAVTVGGVAAYLFWSSATFSTTFSVSAVLDVKINLDDVTQFPDFASLTTISTFHPGNKLVFACDESGNNIQEDLYLMIVATGDYVTAGGVVSASVQRYTIDISDSITALGAVINIADVNAMSPTLLADIAETGTPGSAYVEVTLSPNGGTSYGDYDLDIVLELTDGA